MKLSPLVRALLTALMAGLAAASVLLPTLGDTPAWVGVLIGVVAAVLGALGITPPQMGGMQHGVVSPSLHEPPAADIHEQ